MMASTSASPSQATLATTSAQMLVVARIVGVSTAPLGGSGEGSPEQAAATRAATATAAASIRMRSRGDLAEIRQGWL